MTDTAFTPDGTGTQRDLAIAGCVTAAVLPSAVADRRTEIERHQDSLGSDPPRLCDRARNPVGRNAVDRMAPGLSAPARTTLVRVRRHAGLSAADLLLVVVSLRCLCTIDLPGGSRNRGLGRFRLHRHRNRHVGVARPRSQGSYHLWLPPVSGPGRKKVPPTS